MNLFLAKECLRRIFKALSHCLCVMELWDVRLAEFNQRVRGRRGLLNSLVSLYYSVLYSVPSALSILKGLVIALVEYILLICKKKRDLGCRYVVCITLFEPTADSGKFLSYLM